jgi:chromosome segregation ATPase
MELDVETRNAQLTLAAVREECMQEGAFLAVLYEKKKDVQSEIDSVRAVISSEKAEHEIERDDMQRERDALSERRRDMNSFEAQKTKEIKIAQDQVHEAMKELSKLNSWVVTAEEREKVLRRSLNALESQIEAKNELLRIVKDMHLKERDSMGYTIADAELTKLDAKETVARASRELAQIETQKEAAIEAMKQAEIDRNHMTDEKTRVMNDLEIYIRRVEEKYNEAFPDLRMKL